ncbi:MAG TPA: DUF1080 domain-containing protein [Puia sp.]|jgi:hypothetical protein|nr:DUF1080 domain-containing protein [Puia sp.]
MKRSSLYLLLPVGLFIAATGLIIPPANIAGTEPGIPPPQDPAPNTLSATEKKEGWQLLFDGTSTKGWHAYGHSGDPGMWIVQDGALTPDHSKSVKGDLVTDQDYADFDLKLEWKISPNGNSGVLFHVQEDTAKYNEPYFTGPEMQVLDNDGNADGKIHKHRAGDLYDLVASSMEPVHPVGQWNTVEIYSKGGQLRLFMNGINVVNTTMYDDSWRDMIAHSKFKSWPAFGVAHSGKIDLQDHNFAVWFRNIKIKKP